MPEMLRTWIIPATSQVSEIRLTIREPSLTGDNLGLKTWGTAFTMAKKLEEFGIGDLKHLLDRDLDFLDMGVLELGSGTGLFGLAATAIWQVPVHLTDLPEICNNLHFNVNQNHHVVSNKYGLHGRYSRGKCCVEVLDWKKPRQAFPSFQKCHDALPKFEVNCTLLLKQFLGSLLSISTDCHGR